MDNSSSPSHTASSTSYPPPRQQFSNNDYPFAFDDGLFVDPPPSAGPHSSELFSANETSDLFGFLDNFNWEFDATADSLKYPFNAVGELPMPGGYFGGLEDGLHNSNRPGTSSSTSMGTDHSQHHHPGHPALHALSSHPYANSRPDPRSSTPNSQSSTDPPNSANQLSFAASPTSDASSRPKPLLTDPQKRMNHIMSEQKRRNAIREGYAQLTSLIAPAGAPPGTGMPTRGRPKGSGASARGGKNGGRPGAGKSGVLLRAVEYIRWLEEGRDALMEEVMRVEAAAGIRVDMARV